MKTAICAIIKDEQEYLREWIEHHLSSGIDEIFLYEDYGSMSHRYITEDYPDVHLSSIDIIFRNGFIWEREYSSGSRLQEMLFDWFLVVYKDGFDWVLFIDIDEFLILKTPLEDLLKDYSDYPAILLRWVFYGANGHIRKPDGKVMDNFTRICVTSFDYHWQMKSFVNTKKFESWRKPIHEVKGGIYPLDNDNLHKAFVNHYFTKSWDEWKTKILQRGDTFPNHRKIEEFFCVNPDLLHLKDTLMKEVIYDITS